MTSSKQRFAQFHAANARLAHRAHTDDSTSIDWADRGRAHCSLEGRRPGAPGSCAESEWRRSDGKPRRFRRGALGGPAIDILAERGANLRCQFLQQGCLTDTGAAPADQEYSRFYRAIIPAILCARTASLFSRATNSCR
jgi:hypothetical protein